MIKVTKEGDNSKAIIFKDVALPTVEEVMEVNESPKGNRTFHYKREAFNVFVPDGMYEVVVQVTAYVKSGTITSSSLKEIMQPRNVTKDAVQALLACGFTPEEATQIVMGK